jgi:hypothetical protein
LEPLPLSPKVREGERFPLAERPTDGGIAMQYNYWLISIADEVELESSLWDDTLLGCSPTELFHNVEQDREISFADHQGCPELRLWEDGFSQL